MAGPVLLDMRGVMTYLDLSRGFGMPTIKVSSKVEDSVWEDLKNLARDSKQSISGLLTVAIREYVFRRRVRPDVLRHLDSSIAENKELGNRLAE
jgi:hypothetical protein